MSKPDYTAYLETNLERTEKDWDMADIHTKQLTAVERVLHQKEIRSVLEIGCGSGRLAQILPSINYTGFDKSKKALQLARQRNPTADFLQGDIRTASLPEVDLVISFSFMKHFALKEWEQILGKVLAPCKYALFSIPINETKDDGVEFPHVWVSEEYLKKSLKNLGFQIIDYDDSEVEWNVLVERC